MDDYTLPSTFDFKSMRDTFVTMRPFGDIKHLTHTLPSAMLCRSHWRIADYAPITHGVRLVSKDLRFTVWVSWETVHKVCEPFNPDLTR